MHELAQRVRPERRELRAGHIGAAYPVLHRVAVLVGAAGVRVNIVVDAGETGLDRHLFGGFVTRQGGPAHGLETQSERVEGVPKDGS